MPMMLLYRTVAGKSITCEKCLAKIYEAWTRKPQGFRNRGSRVMIDPNGEPHKCFCAPRKTTRPQQDKTQEEFNF